jgi:UDP-N-acetylglucosamine/UDP-N-acetylgalactosamine diphosphorylase
MNNEIIERLKLYNQEHLLKFWGELPDSQRNILVNQLEDIDWHEINGLIKTHVLNVPGSIIPNDLSPAPFFPMHPKNDEQKKMYSEATKKGKELLSNGRVAAFTVAGGQGTRLGFDGPKGTYPITPIKEKSLFQYFSESLRRASEKFNADIPWYIMTSDMNDEITRDFFKENLYFGLSDIMFLKQGTMPVIGNGGKILLDEKYSLALASNGHGGSLLALKNSGALDDMKKRGVDYLSYFQVDNPLVSVINPLLIGLHFLEKSEMSSIMLSKTGPFEKLGNFCISNGKLMIVEYSDMPLELAGKTDESGNLCFVAGSPAIHVINRKFIERLTQDGTSLPWHRAEKKVSYIDGVGEKIQPKNINAVKLETFIFDALPLANKTILLEAARGKEFAPTKNKIGVDSVESCRKMLISRDADRLEKFARIKIPRKTNGEPDCTVELSPLKYFDDEDVANDAKLLSAKVPLKGEKVFYE